jgi:nitrite reductase (cytochrome c-552)
MFYSAAIMMGAILFCASGCAPDRPMPIKVGGIADNEFNPEEWGKVYPLHYESWLKTREPKKSGQSTYRRGWDDDRVVYDRLSELPFSALLYNGWGFGVEYNEPRGHHYSVIDQVEIDPSRTAPGGVCLACKSPFYKTYLEKKGNEFLKAKFMDAVNMLPEKMKHLGPACIDCHKPSDMGLTTNKTHIEKGLAMLGKKDLNRQDRRVTACAQCHMTYYVPRDRDRKVTGDVVPPWYSST